MRPFIIVTILAYHFKRNIHFKIQGFSDNEFSENTLNKVGSSLQNYNLQDHMHLYLDVINASNNDNPEHHTVSQILIHLNVC